MTDEEKEALREENARFREWQQIPDTPEVLATIPRLTLEDLETDPTDIPTDVVCEDGVEIISHPLHTRGISYLDLFFNASDADEDELHHLRLLTELLFEFDTKKGSSSDFRNRTKEHLGAFYVAPQQFSRHGEGRFYILLHASCLASEKEHARDLIEEYLYSTLYNDAETLKTVIKQCCIYSSENLISRGDYYAGVRESAKHSFSDAITEHANGLEFHRFMNSLLADIDGKAEATLARLREIADKFFRRERLTVGIIEPDGLDYARSIISIVRTGGTKCGNSPVKLIDKVNEGIAIPAAISFAARGTSLRKVGRDLQNGSFSILQSMVSLELLWNEIRVKNGAYDTGISIKPSDALFCYSYRDPSPMASIDYFSRVPDDMDAFLDTSPDLLKFIIGVFGGSDTVTTPRTDGATATKRYLTGRTFEDILKKRHECLDTTLNELRRINGIFREAMKDSTFTVVGPRAELEKIEGIDRILDI